MIGLAVVLFHVIFGFLFFGVVLGFCSFRCRARLFSLMPFSDFVLFDPVLAIVLFIVEFGFCSFLCHVWILFFLLSLCSFCSFERFADPSD
jgi:uncharacterized membrane protein YccF (DUF307 family)